MVRFKSIKWKNFQAAGNVWVEVKLDNTPMTLIVGKNGAGKSTLLDAFCFVNFGRAYRKFNKSDVVNTINKKDCRVVETFEISGDLYEVERGLAPAIFEIRKNGKRLEISGEKDNQAKLEEILGCNYKTFIWMAILGKANYKPFMELDAAERRAFIEDVLDIQVFTVMNKLIKEKIKVVQNNNAMVESELKALDSRVVALKKAQQEATSNFQEQIDSATAQIEALVPQIDQYEKDITEKSVSLEGESEVRQSIQYSEGLKRKIESKMQMLSIRDQIEAEVAEIANLSDKIDQYEKDITEKSLPLAQESNIRLKIKEYTDLKIKIGSKLQTLATQTLFLEDHDNCPQCKQAIAHDYKDEILGVNRPKIEELQTGLKELDKRIHGQESKYQELQVIKDVVNQLKSKLAAAKSAKSTREQALVTLKKKITEDLEGATEAKFREEISVLDVYISEYEQKIRDFDVIKTQINQIKSKLAAAKGIKNTHTINIASLKKKMEQAANSGIALDIENTTAEIAEKTEIKNGYLVTLRRYNKTLLLLKDDAIKGKIINESLPLINKTVNDYLKQMDFFVQIEFDEEFNETIRSRYRDTFKWNHFSEGEKMRINLAILLTWRSLAASNARMDANLLIMDEILNGSLEEEGIDDFFSIIERNYSDRNIFVISHSADMMADKFQNVLKFEKKDGFSTMVEA